jgi:membrane-associated phospholipid phosphatase
VKLSSRTLLLGAAGCAGLFCLILALAYLSARARELDANALQGFLGVQDENSHFVFRKLGHLGDAKWVGLEAAILVAVALLRGRPRLAIAVVGLLAVTSVSSQILKALLEYPRWQGDVGLANVAPAAFPSGHSTAAMSVAIAGVIVAPARIRPVAALVGCGLALTVGLAVVSVGFHFPSDVAGGFLLAAGWGFLLALALQWAEARRPERVVPGRAAATVRRMTDFVTTTGLTAVAVTGFVILVAAALIIGLTRPGDVVDMARDHTAALLVGSAIAALAVGLLGGITLSLRRRG